MLPYKERLPVDFSGSLNYEPSIYSQSLLPLQSNSRSSRYSLGGTFKDGIISTWVNFSIL